MAKKKTSIFLIVFLISLIAVGVIGFLSQKAPTEAIGTPQSWKLIIPVWGSVYCTVINPNIPLEYDAVGESGYMGKGFWIQCNRGSKNKCDGEPIGTCGHNIYTDQCKIDYKTRDTFKDVLLSLNVDECNIDAENKKDSSCNDEFSCINFPFLSKCPDTDGIWAGDWILPIGKKMFFNPTAHPIDELGSLETGDMKVRVIADQYGLEMTDHGYLSILNSCDLSKLATSNLPSVCEGDGCEGNNYPQTTLEFNKYFNYLADWTVTSLDNIRTYNGQEVYCIAGCGSGNCDNGEKGILAPIKTMKDNDYRYADVYNKIYSSEIECCPRQSEICESNFKLSSEFDPYGDCPCASGWWNKKDNPNEVCLLDCNTQTNKCEPTNCHTKECRTNADCISIDPSKPICSVSFTCISGGGGGDCGDGTCQKGENIENCPDDCKKDTTFFWIILIGLGVIVIILLIIIAKKRKPQATQF